MIGKKASININFNISKSFCFIVVFILFFSSFLGIGVVSNEDVFIFTDSFVPGEFIIKFKDDVNDFFCFSDSIDTGNSSLNSLNVKYNVVSQEKLFDDSDESDYLSNYYRLKFSSNKDIMSLISDYENLDFVEFAEPNYVYTINKIPNDPQFGSQWGLNQENDCDIDAPKAWDIETGSSDVVVAVVDTGVDYNHEDLKDNIFRDSNGDVIGYNFVGNNDNPMDDHNHGTHCAGIIGAVGNNNVGISGVCWDISIMPVKVLSSSGSGSASGVADGICYAADNGADVISMSLGGSQNSQTINNAINHAISKGVVLVAAAGNDNTQSKSYPAGNEDVIAVAATNRNDDKASFSNYGDWVDVAAPGVSILSTLIDNDYGSYSGTSMACPHVAGLIGLILSKKPSLSVDEVRTILRSTTDELNSNKPIGTGRINAYKALKSFLNLDYSPKSHDFGDMYKDESDSTSFEVWNNATEEMNYSLSESCDWLSVSPKSGSSSNSEKDTITVDIDTSGLDYGSYNCIVNIESNDQNGVFNVSVNVVSHPPDKPTDPKPSDGVSGVSVDPTFLSVDVSDPDDDLLSVSFFDAGDDSEIGFVDDVESGETVTVEWDGLDYNTSYSWYVVVNDSVFETVSDVFGFTTNSPPVFSNMFPMDGSLDVSFGVANLSLDISDPDGDSFSWSISTSSNIGSNYSSGDVDGTKFCNVDGLMPDTEYVWTVTAVDSKGAESESVFSFKTRENMAPEMPVAVSPGVDALDVSIVCTLNWSCMDPDGDMDLVYDVYFGKNSNPELLEESISDECYGIGYDLDLDTVYYWKIKATDSFGASSESSVFSFRTSPVPPPPSPGSIDIGFPKKFSRAGVKADILNKGSRDASNLLWHISVTGGLFNRVNMSENGCINRLNSTDMQEISTYEFLDFKSRPFGIGRVKTTLVTSNVHGEVVGRASKEGFLLGSFLLFLK